MAVREMKMIPDEVGMVGLAFLRLSNLTNGNAKPDDTFKNLSEMFETKKFKWVVIGIWW